MVDVGWTNMSDNQQTAGAGIFYDVHMLGVSLFNGDWDSVGIYGATAVIDGVATAMDPFGSLIAAGLGWVMEHFEPLKGWLDDLAGDPAAILAQAADLDSIKTNLTTYAQELCDLVRVDVGGMEAASIQAYETFVQTITEGFAALATSVQGGAEATRIASSIVEFIRGVVRDAIAQVCGALISYAAELLISLGTATPYVIAQAQSRVASLSSNIALDMMGMTRSFDALDSLLTDGAVAALMMAKKLEDLMPNLPRFADIPRNLPTVGGSNAGSTAGNNADDDDPYA